MADKNDRYELLFPSEYIRAADLCGKDVTKTIKKVHRTELQMKGGAKKMKAVIEFSDSDKKLVANRTNADMIAELYGPYVSKWVGQKITMYPTTTTFGRDTVECVRVRGHASAKVDPDTGEVAGYDGDDRGDNT